MNSPYPRIDIETTPPHPLSAFGPPPDVLIVDDNIAGAQTLAMLLEMQGYSVLTTNSGNEALTIVEQRRPAAILLDLGLPDMNGIEVARTIRQRDLEPRATIIVLSGGELDPSSSSSTVGLFDHVLTKPVEFEALQAVLPAPSTSVGTA